MNERLSLPLFFAIALTLNCKTETNAQTLTDVLKYSNESNLTNGVDLSNYAIYSIDAKAFIGLIERDTVIGFCIDSKCADNYDVAGFNSAFSINKLRLDFQDGTFSVLKPFQIEKSTKTEGKTTYYLKQYFFKVDDLKKLDRPIKIIKITDEKSNVTHEIYGASFKPGMEYLEYFIRAYLIPMSISNLDVLPHTSCTVKYQGMEMEFAFAKLFTRTKSGFCDPSNSAKCKCD